MAEQWRDVPGWEGRYLVSNQGRVRSMRNGHATLMRGGRGTKYGHRKVRLGFPAEGHWVHRLVLRAFVGEPPEGAVARHLDGNPENNRLDNLAWGTPAENNADALAHGTATRGSQNGRAALSEQDVYAILALHHVAPASYVAPLFGVAENTVARIWGGSSWRWLHSA